MELFNVNSWISNHYRIIDDIEERLKSSNNSLQFVWIWAIFEREIISKGVKGLRDNDVDKIVSSLRDTVLEKIQIENFIKEFRKRYFNENNEITRELKSLGFPNERFNNLKSALLNPEAESKEKLEVLVIISYKFRCNLFHGNKNPLLWHEFENIFGIIIRLLTEIIDNQASKTPNTT